MRNFDDWISAFIEYTEGIKSPRIFRRWAGASAIAAALQRCSYTLLGQQRLFPNLYIVLVSYPGVGKSNAIRHSREIARKVPDIHLAPNRLTPRAFYNEIELCKSEPIRSTSLTTDPLGYTHHSLTAMIDELSVFIRPRSTEFMADLCDAYDCPDPFEHKTSTQGEIRAENSFFNLIGGCTPGYLAESWTKTVLDEGFPARCIIVFSDEKVRVPMGVNEENASELDRFDLQQRLSEDLRDMASLRGRFFWEKDAAEALQAWADEGMPPAPTDDRLEHYAERRHVHLCTLSMIKAAGRSSEMLIALEDLRAAQDMLFEAEDAMPKALESMGGSPHKDAISLVEKAISKKSYNSGLPEHEVRAILISEMDARAINGLLIEMVNAKRLVALGEPPNRRFFIYGKVEKK